MKRRLLSISLALCMVISLLPISAQAAQGTYSDTAGHWAESAIERWSEYGVLQGSGGRFRPNDPITRAEIAAVLDRVMKYQATDGAAFTDVDPAAWYYGNVRHLAAAGVVSGVGDNRFAPGRSITREEAAVMMGRAFNVPGNSGNENPFPDAGKISGWASFLVDGMKAAGYISGYPDGSFGHEPPPAVNLPPGDCAPGTEAEMLCEQPH